MGKPEIDLSIIIVSYNSLSFLKDAIGSILSHPPKASYEIIVVDNASTDGSAQFVKANFPAVRVITNERNFGFAKANNIAIRSSDCRFVLLMNSDCKVYEGSLDALLNFMEENPAVGVVGPRIVNSDGSIQLSCRRFPSMLNAGLHSLLTDIFPNNPFSRKYKLADVERNKPFAVDWVSGSFMLIRRKALDEIGLLDERYFMYAEDVDLCFRMWKNNWQVFYFPHASVLHYIGGSSKEKEFVSCFRMQKSIFYFFWKHYKNSFKIILIPFLAFVLSMRVLISFIKSIFNIRSLSGNEER
ncbi:MAG: glycosyltransferase family 2 protein [Actinobacteria bacterium]|nr:glycosyltransferase family 2 protein [Actinomycetota bacterium]